ncbi:hypothetical protein CXG81DRAFT_10396 [Caulochytrium protostelioides]|uniref:Fumarylacetoacetase n=1 Tax=Caulochytrium protostelioides TaxID=1555241 RepID=A0A4P9XBK7_9FUNG|nr:hypothetical protein CXG81DRAFT_10396 [Caulochytrium protostelioides]|eukprot:RKP02765.1 hypothetical protein CXG81DRAFT_10396 [Caulochytrium protostelioides]
MAETFTLADVSADADFTLHNIPFGVIAYADRAPRCASAIGAYAIDLAELADRAPWAFHADGALSAADAARDFREPCLNVFMSRPRAVWVAARHAIQRWLQSLAAPSTRAADADAGADADADADADAARADVRIHVLVPLAAVTMHLPAQIGDYTDFYASKEHATRAGTIFRGAHAALQPNWVHLPVGYHGRASSIVVSGTPVRRPWGLCRATRQPDPATAAPVFGPCRQLDFELELAAWVGGAANALGTPVPLANGAARDRLFGVTLLNDWSARDIQAYEAVPLGPFLGKSFGSTVSPWIVTFEALEAVRVPLPDGTRGADAAPWSPATGPYDAAYLVHPDPSRAAVDIELAVHLRPAEAAAVETAAPLPVTTSNAKYMYWSFEQQLAHHSINGCNLRPGDVLGTGTLSGPALHQLGSFLELSHNGTQPCRLAAASDGIGVERRYLEDGDELILTARCRGTTASGEAVSFGFGEARGRLLPALTREQVLGQKPSSP